VGRAGPDHLPVIFFISSTVKGVTDPAGSVIGLDGWGGFGVDATVFVFIP
jgi:hypothetical protein